MPFNLHGTALVLGDRGIVIAGDSGAGKTQLALALICHARTLGVFARLVADDQIFLVAHGGRLICVAPDTIAGLVEIRGIGPRAVDHELKAPVDLLLRLVDWHTAQRFPEAETESMLGCDVPVLKLAAGDRQAATLAVLFRLSLPPFG